MSKEIEKHCKYCLCNLAKYNLTMITSEGIFCSLDCSELFEKEMEEEEPYFDGERYYLSPDTQ